MAELKIKVGASLDRSFEAVLQQLGTATAKAQRKIVTESEKNAKAQGTALAKGVKKGTDEAEKAYQHLVASIEGKSAKMMAPATRAILEHARQTKASFRGTMAAFDQQARHIEAGLRKQEAAHRRAARAGGLAGGLSVGLGMGGGAVNLAFAGAQKVVDIAGSFVRGAGVNTSLESIAGRNADLQEQASNLANAAYMPGDKGANGIRRRPEDLIATVRDVAIRTGSSSEDAMGGLQEFVAKTGDLATAVASLDKMASLAKATGASLRDVMSASADIATNMGDVSNKGEKLDAIMRLVASQTKIGSVEMADWAKKMPKIAAAAGQLEGDFGTNVTKLAALGQIAKQGGGASSAAEAATSISGLINTLKTPARAKEFAKNGIDVFGGGGMLRDPVEIMLAALKKTGGDPLAMKKMFANVTGERAVTGLANVYRRAGGGEAGEKAFRDALEAFTKELMTADEVQKALNETLKTQKSQAQIFNEKMAKIVEEISGAILPALIGMAPTILSASKGVADLMMNLFGDKAKRLEGITGGTNADGKRLAATVQAGIDAGAVPESAVQAIADQRAKQKEKLAELDAQFLKDRKKGFRGPTGIEYGAESFQRKFEADGVTPAKAGLFGTGGDFGGYESKDIQARAETYRSQRSETAELLETLERQYSTLVEALQGGGVQQVHIVKDDVDRTPVKPPKHSPLGGRASISSGC